MSKTLIAMILLVPLLFAGTLLTTEPPPPDADLPHAFLVDRTFEGADRCKTCHRKPEDGEQYPKWQEGPHAKAYETLAGDEAKAIAAERGIENPQTADECLQCHVTGHGVAPELLGDKYQITDGVGCESCHGAGGDYYKKKDMTAIFKGEVDGASLGLVIPTEETCVGCHNDKSPTFKGFNFEEASQKIAHPIPDAKKAEYDQ